MSFAHHLTIEPHHTHYQDLASTVQTIFRRKQRI